MTLVTLSGYEHLLQVSPRESLAFSGFFSIGPQLTPVSLLLVLLDSCPIMHGDGGSRGCSWRSWQRPKSDFASCEAEQNAVQPEFGAAAER